MNNCLKQSWLLDILIWSRQLEVVYNNMFLFLGDETTWCINGGLESPRYLQAQLHCSQPRFSRLAQACVTSYQRSFRSQSPPLKLCQEYASAQLCLQKLQTFHCSSLNNDVIQMLNVISQTKLHFLPFCNSRQTENKLILHQNETEQCPPWFSNDIIMIVDNKSSFLNKAKNVAFCLLRKFPFGENGMKLSLLQFDSSSIQTSIDFNDFKTKEEVIDGLNRVKLKKTFKKREHILVDDVLQFVLSKYIQQIKKQSLYFPIILLFSNQNFQIDSLKKETLIITTNEVDEKTCSVVANEICSKSRNLFKTQTINNTREYFPDDLSHLQLLHQKTERLGLAYLPLMWNPVAVSHYNQPSIEIND